MAKQLRQARAVLRAGRDYLRYDLPEIVFPSSMPNPPGVEPKPRRERREYVAVRVAAPGACCCVCMLLNGFEGRYWLLASGCQQVILRVCRCCCHLPSADDAALPTRPRLQLFLLACRRYADSWDSAKMEEERLQQLEREGRGAEAQAQRREAEQGPGLAAEFGERAGCMRLCGALPDLPAPCLPPLMSAQSPPPRVADQSTNKPAPSPRTRSLQRRRPKVAPRRSSPSWPTSTRPGRWPTCRLWSSLWRATREASSRPCAQRCPQRWRRTWRRRQPGRRAAGRGSRRQQQGDQGLRRPAAASQAAAVAAVVPHEKAARIHH
jgi:hypothetical protein